jgi:hypothetical protein
MNKSEAKEIAIDFVARSNIQECAFESIRFIPKSEIEPHDYWAVIFAWEESDDYVDTPDCTIVEVDDTTGEACLFETL